MSPIIIRIKDLHQSFGSQKVLRGVNLEVIRGETLVLLGGSGGGKSVLVKHIPALLVPKSGEVWVDDENITPLDERELESARKKIGMMFQGGALFDSFTLFENVAFPLREGGMKDEEIISERVLRALKIVKLSGHEDKFPSDISGGMRKRVALARAVVDQPELIIYDEPHAGLDPVTADTIDHLIKDLQRDHGITNIVITHEIRSMFRIADRVVFMKDGVIYWLGTPDELKNSSDPLLKNFINGVSDEKW